MSFTIKNLEINFFSHLNGVFFSSPVHSFLARLFFALQEKATERFSVFTFVLLSSRLFLVVSPEGQ